jgi:tRNA dimethylallyltransferase
MIRSIVILGPTAGGKSELAVALAERLDGEVIGADSMQVYRHMDAGTAKPSAELRGRVPHHGIDITEPTEPFTVADWLAVAESLLVALSTRGKTPIIVGGTNFYLKALLEGMFDGPAANADFRASLDDQTPQQLHRRLVEIDPDAADRIAPADRKRIIRALEVFHQTGKPISDLQQQWADASAQPYRHNPILIGLDWPAEAINRRINARVKVMFETLPAEVRDLESRSLLGLQAREALGYKQLLDHFAGRCTLDEAFERTKILTRRFAKAQRTWLKRFRGVHWLPAAKLDETALADAAAEQIVRHIG